ncbi:hypothetical protein IJ818_01690 [bacterium]|nr:hypothetical protein [bacterium]
MAKNNKNKAFGTFYAAISLYTKHLKAFLAYMTFPIIGQVAGLVLIFVLNYHFIVNLDVIQQHFPVFNKPSVIIVSVIILLLPGLCLMLKAFWDYLVAYGAINSMAENMVKSHKLYDIEAHTLLINHRKFSFAALWLLYSIFLFLFVNPLLWILGGLIFVFFALVFQVFTLEPEKNIFLCFHKSFILVKQKYFETLLMLLLISTLTYFIIPELIRLLCSLTGIVTLFAHLIQNIVTLNLQVYIDKFNELLLAVNQPALTVLDISKLIVLAFIGWISSSYLLPLRSLACYLWYKDLNKKYLAKFKKNKKIDVQV